MEILATLVVLAFGLGLAYIAYQSIKKANQAYKEREEERSRRLILFHDKWHARWKKTYRDGNINHHIYIFKTGDEDRHRFLVEARSLGLHIPAADTFAEGAGVEYTLEEFAPTADSE